MPVTTARGLLEQNFWGVGYGGGLIEYSPEDEGDLYIIQGID